MGSRTDCSGHSLRVLHFQVWFKNRRAKWRHQKRASAAALGLQGTKEPPAGAPCARGSREDGGEAAWPFPAPARGTALGGRPG